jgi:hypothetical protein
MKVLETYNIRPILLATRQQVRGESIRISTKRTHVNKWMHNIIQSTASLLPEFRRCCETIGMLVRLSN